ncbi:MAG TPA: polyprenyl diphosphate synthase [Candidatus Dormibacteraeota bacterium]|nr:polyprenyl diphosphate synthase [Candidatus Dormibacteraeota bacterium]
MRLPRPVVRPLYRLYATRLWAELGRAPVPRHVAVILDGNRRYAREEGLPDLRDSYALGARRVWDVLEWSERAGVGVVTLWAMSIDNLGRPATQTAAIEGVVAAELRDLAPHVERRGWRLRVIGRRDLLRPETRDSIAAIEAGTGANTGLTVQIAMGYGGREEILDAIRDWARTPAVRDCRAEEALDRLDLDDVRNHLYGGELPEPELILRTSGEVRLSGFLLWQSVHAEFYFTDVLWPEFREIDFLRALRDWQGRSRRYGR